MFTGNEVTSYSTEDKGIFIIEAKQSVSPIQWIQHNKLLFEEQLLNYGGIFLRGSDIHPVSEFNNFSKELCPNLLEYTYRSTPRSNLGSKIYTATEDQHIPSHNENSYADSWPQKAMFFCVIPAKEGGQTPVADSRKIFKRIDKNIIKKFDKKSILYVRNYIQGIDLSWQEVFQTSNKLEVENYCMNHSIKYYWNDKGPELTTKQVCQATAVHPVTKEKVWFNQAHLLQVSNLRRKVVRSLISKLGECNLPGNTYYGDESPLEDGVLDHIRNL